jgi:CBS domain-containing protein
MGRWQCYRCSYQVEAESPPEECPGCHYSISFWINQAEEAPLTLKDFVRTTLVRMDGNETVLRAARTMRERDTENILVTVDGKPTGMVTEKDILDKIAAEDLNASKVPIRNIMSSSLITAPVDTSVADALRMMAAHHIRRLIVTENGSPIGVVSHRSILGGSFRATGDVMTSRD